LGDSKADEGVLLRFDEAGTGRALILQDDGRVAYAYLLVREELVGDVWLYNVAPAPEDADWKDPSKLPFLNPRSFCRAETMPRLDQKDDVKCVWLEAGVEVNLNGVRIARLEVGAKPGWSRLALRPGPLAKPLE
jgi:hypothetical protein